MSPLYLYNNKLLTNNSKLAVSQNCCCEAPCSCGSSDPKVWITIDGITRGYGLDGSTVDPNWAQCIQDFGPPNPNYSQFSRSATVECFVDKITITIDIGYSSIGYNCCTPPCDLGTYPTIIGKGTRWIYEYSLNANGCPYGSPLLISETTTDNTNLCSQENFCCNQGCWGAINAPSLSLTAP